MSRVLDVAGLDGGYGSVQILKDISLHVDEGEFVTIIGPNGCGKSTFIKVIFGIATHYRGTVKHRGESIAGWRTDQLVQRGIAYVPQVDNVFPGLNVRENLEMGGVRLPPTLLEERISRALEMFPDLQPRLHDTAASLSGGSGKCSPSRARSSVTLPSCCWMSQPRRSARSTRNRLSSVSTRYVRRASPFSSWSRTRGSRWRAPTAATSLPMAK